MRRLSEPTERKILFGLWVLVSLLLMYFHEPWRDEAQAWLTARSSANFQELLFRSSMEGTGPLYYLLIWPFARFYPEHFHLSMASLSWIGMVGAVHASVFGFRWRWCTSLALLFTFIFGYQYAAVARLYGWGTFLLILGIQKDEKKLKSGPWFLGLALFIQMNFAFAVMAWCLAKALWQWKRDQSFLKAARAMLFRYGPVAFFILVSLVHLHLAANERVWSGWSAEGFRFSHLGTSLSLLFLPGPYRIGWGGFAVALLGLVILKGPRRWAFALAMVPYSFMFCFKTGFTEASARHAGPLFLIWFLFAVDSWSEIKKIAYQKWAFRALVAGTCVFFLRAAVTEIRDPYSDGEPLAWAIQNEHAQSPKPIWLYVNQDIYGFVTMSVLNLPEVTVGRDFRKSSFPYFSKERERKLRSEAYQIDWGQVLLRCPPEADCFVIRRPRDSEIPQGLEPSFKNIYRPLRPPMTDEWLWAYHLTP